MLHHSPGPQSALQEEAIAAYSRIFRTQEEVEEEVDWENAAAHVSDKDDEDAE